MLFIAALVAMVLTGCRKEEAPAAGEGTNRTFTADFATAKTHDQKVHLDEVGNNGLRPGWDAGDQINVNGGVCNVTDIGDNASRAKFAGVLPEGRSEAPYYSVYPIYGQSCGSEYAGGQITFAEGNTEPAISVTLPRVQFYRDASNGGLQLVDAPMAAYNEQKSYLQFHNLCGLMKIVVTNDKAWDMVLDSIQVEASDYNLWGTHPLSSPSSLASSIAATANDGKNIISLARAGEQSINATVLTNAISGRTVEQTTCTLYVYLPPIAQGSTNAFTVRVFSHPLWGSTPDPEVHIVYTQSQSGTSNGYIAASETLNTPISLAGCGLFGTTFTSMKAFTSPGNGSFCFSRGNLQYYAIGNNQPEGGLEGKIRFAPRQWVFETTVSYSTNISGTTWLNSVGAPRWIDHFCWASGNNFEYYTQTEARHDNGNKSFYQEGSETGVDWGDHLRRRNTWSTPKRSMLYNLFPWENPNLAATIKQDSSSRFVWVSLTGVVHPDNPSVVLSSATTPLCGIMIIPDAYRRQFVSIHQEAGALTLGLPQFKLKVNDMKQYNDNVLTVQQFEYYEAKGCIFLPCLGSYNQYGSHNDPWNNSMSIADGPEGTYWSSTFNNNNSANLLKLKAKPNSYSLINNRHTYVGAESDQLVNHPACVRLVCPYGTAYRYDPDQM